MKLIDEKEVEEAARSYATRDGHFVINPHNEAGIRATIKGFNEGTAFAEQKIQPMMVELIDWIDENEWNNSVTSLEKLEQFLKTEQR